MAVLHAAGAPLTTSGYTLLIADDPTLVAAAQRLRHEVFATELGASLPPDAAGLDTDEFDAHCDHLVVLREGTDEVVGTYRLLPPGRTDRRYADGEFDLTALAPLRDDLVEAGRSCVHPGHRSGAVINLMWAGITRYLHLRGSRWLGGCASVPVADGGAAVDEVWRQVTVRHLAPPPLRVTPRRPWFPEPTLPAAPAAPASLAAPASSAGRASTAGTAASAGGRALVPPLLRGYLRLGAWVCGEPAYDPDFDCADFYVLLSMDRLNPRYLRHFLGQVAS